MSSPSFMEASDISEASPSSAADVEIAESVPTPSHRESQAEATQLSQPASPSHASSSSSSFSSSSTPLPPASSEAPPQAQALLRAMLAESALPTKSTRKLAQTLASSSSKRNLDPTLPHPSTLPPPPVSEFSVSYTDLKPRWGRWTPVIWSGCKLLYGAEFLGEVFADMLGITDSRYQYVLDAYQRAEREKRWEKEERKAERRKRRQERGQMDNLERGKEEDDEDEEEQQPQQAEQKVEEKTHPPQHHPMPVPEAEETVDSSMRQAEESSRNAKSRVSFASPASSSGAPESEVDAVEV